MRILRVLGVAVIGILVGFATFAPYGRFARRPASGPGADAPLAARSAPATVDPVARGRYLTEGLLRCFICHSERDWEQPGAPPVNGMKGAGFVWSDDGTYQLVAPNLTPDEETGILRWSDAQLGRAIRQGIAHDGRRLDRTMPAFRHLADEDLAAVIAYLRSLPPVRNPLPRTVLPAAEQTSNDRRPPVRLKPRALANGADPVERGRTLVLLGECTGCHTSWHSPRMPGLLGGGNLIRNGERASFSTNLTPHPSGMPYDAEAFIHVLRTGKRGGLRPLMPWIVYRNLSDDDLRAMHAFLRTMYPVAHYVGNSAEPTQCPACGQVHPLGELNHIETPQRVVPDPLLVADYVGKYHSEEWGFTVIVTRSGDRLFAQWNARPRIELHPLSDTLFTAELAPLRFIRDTDGNVARIVSLEVEEVVLEKVR